MSSLNRLAATLASLLLAAGVAQATTHDVPGTYATIQAAVNAAAPGDTVLVAPGTYVENVTIGLDIALLSSGGRASTTIQGISNGALGTVLVNNATTGVQIGALGQGFTIIGIDNNNPGVENAAVYFQGAASGASIIDNEVQANGDHGLLTEYGATVSGFTISDNTFSGSTFFDPPAGDGFGSQFTLPNVPRQLVTMGCGGGCTNTSAITFTNNVISGTAGGINTSSAEQGNTCVTIDADGAVITGNLFAPTTTRFGTSLRARGPNTTISGNTFDSSGLTPTTGHIYLQGTGSTAATVAGANTFDKGVYVDGTTATIGISIQNYVLAVPTGTTIDVLSGTYREQVVIDGKDVTLTGAGKATTTIEAPDILATTFTTSGPNKPVVSMLNSGGIVVQGFTIDGRSVGNANNRIVGLGVQDGGGALLDCDIVNIEDNPQSGVQAGVGILTWTTAPGPFALEVGNVDISAYQKNAMVIAGAAMTADIHDCTTTGSGDIGYIAQNGIQFSAGAGGTVTDCTISDMRYTPASVIAAGLLVIDAATVDVSGLACVDVQEAIYYWNTSGTLDGVNVSFVSSAPDYDGMFIYNTTAARAPSGARTPIASPWVEAAGRSGAGATAATTYTVNLSNGCLTGTGATGTSGLYALSSSATLDVNVSNMTVTGWDYGLVADGAPVSMDVDASSVAGNTTAGYDNSLSGSAQVAEHVWWGAADGPSGDGSGSGDAVVSVGGEVDFDPYLIDGTSSTSCAFTPAANTVAPNPGAVCVSGPTPCVTVPMDITRTDSDNLRGFSVTFTLSPELKLCSGLSSIVEGTYLSSVPSGNTTFQVVDNGGGSYTVDGSLLGLPCGQTAPTGTLFTIDVADSLGTTGTGTITVTGVLLRDCANVPIPAAVGAAALIPVDPTPPAAVTDLAAAQLKTGNDSDGTTKITITFSAPAGADSFMVFRKGYGDYPEYDDGTGAVPTPPTDPANALANGWTLTGVTASGQTDEPAARDFWYYVIFTDDACDNVSAVSNMTGGTLNYHLGDVSDGITPGTGENLVGTADISLLGANYGIALAFNDPVNYLDVGPTTDFFVNARPTTDNQVQFEDLMMFAINFGQVSRVTPPRTELPQDPSIALKLDGEVEGGLLQARLFLEGNAGLVKGIHVRLDHDASALRLVSAEPGALVQDEAAQTFFKELTVEGGTTVDAAVFGPGTAFSGSGEVAVLRFERLEPGPGVALGRVDLRDPDNQPATGRPAVAQESAGDEADVARTGLPAELELVGARPNPFTGGTRIVFRLPQATDVSVRIYDVNGRLVRTVVDGQVAAGENTVTWDGRTDRGDVAGAGVYFYSFQAAETRTTRKIVRLQ